MNWRFLGEPWTLGQADRLKQLIAREPQAAPAVA
jgi:hypothetical protein